MIPPTRYINPGPMPAQASAGPAMAAGQATVEIGRAFENLGETGLRIIERKRKVEEAGKMSAFMANLDEEASQFSLELARRSDTENWIPEWKEKTNDIQRRAKELGLSPDAQARLGMELADWQGRRNIQLETLAASKSLEIARGQVTNSLEYYESRGDEEGFNRTLGSALAGGILDPAEGEKAKHSFARQSAGIDLQRMAEEDPEGFESRDTESLLNEMPGATLEQVEQAKQYAGRVKVDRQRQTVDDIYNKIASEKITLPEELDQYEEQLGAHNVERIKNHLRARNSDEYKAQMADPENQRRIFGEVSRKLREYNPSINEVDMELVEMQSMLQDLPDSPLKSELLAQMQEKRTGKKSEIKSKERLALSALDEAAKNGRFGAVPEVEKLKVLDLVKQGFLKDGEKLKRLGFSESQAGKIIDEAKKDPAKGQAKFIELWTERESGSVNASEIEIETAHALRLGHATIAWDDPQSVNVRSAKQAEIDQQLGTAKAKLADWMSANPNATDADINKKIIELGGEGVRKSVRESRLPERPSRFSPDKSTSMNVPESLKPLETAFIEAGQTHGIDPRLLVAISMHETANGTSSAFRNKNNAMGVSNSKGPIAFGDPSESIERMARLLGSSTSGPYKNARTIAQIGAIYAPIGAGNDPRSLNRHWVDGVSKYFRQLGGNPLALIK